mmetsp:Transcript_10494/g.11774  ORF Transcript_10494/g.11774 Transcript_10494/m.11774 type:complete len:162 (+) Transcript_10494:1172-1657(+)
MSDSKPKVEDERGQEEEKKLNLKDNRRLESKALFERQLQSIQKTIIHSEFKDKTEPSFPRPDPVKYAKAEKHEKVTALAGSGIVNHLSKHNDDFIITTTDREETKHTNRFENTKRNYGDHKPHSSTMNLDKGKRLHTGFKTSAAAMFHNQTGEKCVFTDYS